MQERSPGYFPHIDGLRAIAVLAVILYHLKASWLPGGFTGVDVFFVISGFVVSASVDRLPAVGGWAGLARFYARRMRRIAPALVVCLLFTAMLSALLIPESWLSETSDKTGRMAFVGLSNWVLASTGNDYFSPRTEFNPYTHTWSLGVEEQFYLLFPLLFLAWAKGPRGRWVSLGLFGVAVAASLGYAVFRARQGGHEIDAFYLTTTRFWQLGAGVLLFQVLSLSGRFTPLTASPRGISWRSPLLLLSVGALGYGLWSARPGHSPWIDGLWPVLGTLGLLGLLQRAPGGWIGRALATTPMVTIGRLSYSLYLWHWPVFVLFRWTVGLETVATGAAALLCVALLSWLSWRWVEQPLRHGGRWRISNARWVAVGVAVLVLGAGLQTALVKTQQYTSLSVVSRAPLDWYPYAKGLKKEIPDCRVRVSNVPVQGGQARLYERGQCPGRAASTRQLFVAGDSHALAYHEMLQRLAVLDGATIRLYGSGGCALVGLRAWQGPNPACDAYVRNVLEDIQARAQPGDVVLLAGLRLPRLSEQYTVFDIAQVRAEHLSEAADAGRRAEVASWIAQLTPLAGRGVHIVLEAPKPVLPAPPYRCSDVFNRHNPICVNGMTVQRSEIEQLRAPVLAVLQQVADALPGASIWDPMPLLCPGEQCLPTREGKPLFFDGDHLSGYGNRLLLPDFQAQLKRLEATAPAAAP
ncbi:acyltransferase family protein [Stenotrophomonas sp. Ste96]|uniref:acyltransferase family protein n=1 Tax=Stenotrophomonas sp. Ste96 TaxID=2926029 RepID=UPI0021C8FCFB|nr:acyltransferase family protein [Stenotrophomonas sp. Ste96]